MPSPTHVLNLVAAADAAEIDDAIIGSVREICNGAGAPRWLSPRRACDLTVDANTPVDRLRTVLEPHRIDANLVATATRRKRLLIADMDSTMVEQETLDELAAIVGKGDAVAEITTRAMAGELDFKQALRERIAMIAGTPRDVLEQVAAEIRLVAGGAALVGTMRANGAYAALVSGGFTDIVGRTADMLGFDTFQANRFTFEGDVISGVAEPILDQDAKLSALQRLTADQGLTPTDAIAVGDGANDVAMLRAAGLGVAFRAKPKVRAQVDIHVTHADLTALLYLQGYTDQEIAAQV